MIFILYLFVSGYIIVSWVHYCVLVLFLSIHFSFAWSFLKLFSFTFYFPSLKFSRCLPQKIEWASARVPPTPLLGGWAEGGWSISNPVTSQILAWNLVPFDSAGYNLSVPWTLQASSALSIDRPAQKNRTQFDSKAFTSPSFHGPCKDGSAVGFNSTRITLKEAMLHLSRSLMDSDTLGQKSQATTTFQWTICLGKAMRNSRCYRAFASRL